MAAPSISNAAAIAACDAIVDRVDNGPAAGKLKIYAGSIPANADAALGGATLLAELTMSDPAFGNAADQAPDAQATANAITSDTSADATGTATFFRVEDSNGNVEIQGDVSNTAGSGDLKLTDTSIVATVEVQVTSFTFTVPEA